MAAKVEPTSFTELVNAFIQFLDVNLDETQRKYHHELVLEAIKMSGCVQSEDAMDVLDNVGCREYNDINNIAEQLLGILYKRIPLEEADSPKVYLTLVMEQLKVFTLQGDKKCAVAVMLIRYNKRYQEMSGKNEFGGKMSRSDRSKWIEARIVCDRLMYTLCVETVEKDEHFVRFDVLANILFGEMPNPVDCLSNVLFVSTENNATDQDRSALYDIVNQFAVNMSAENPQDLCQNVETMSCQLHETCGEILDLNEAEFKTDLIVNMLLIYATTFYDVMDWENCDRERFRPSK